MVIRRCCLVLFGVLSCLLMCRADGGISKLISPPKPTGNEPAVDIALLGEISSTTKATPPVTPAATPSLQGDTTALTFTPSPSTVSPDPDPTSSSTAPTTPTTPKSSTTTTTTTAPSPLTTKSTTPKSSTGTTSATTLSPSPSPTTLKPTVTPSTANPHNGSVTTETPDTHHRQFDGPSFVGGIVLASGLMAIGFVAFKFYKARTERNYHTL